MDVQFINIGLAISGSFIRVAKQHVIICKVDLELMELNWDHDGFKNRDFEIHLHLHLRDIKKVAQLVRGNEDGQNQAQFGQNVLVNVLGLIWINLGQNLVEI